MKSVEASWEGTPGFQATMRSPAQLDFLTKKLYMKCPRPKFGYRLSHPEHLSQSQIALYNFAEDTMAAAKHLKCAMHTYPQRYCQKQARKELAEQIRGYLQLRQDTLAWARQVSRRPKTKYEHITQHLAEARGGVEIKGRHPVEQVDTSVVAGLNYLRREGYFSDWDFGGFLTPNVPNDLQGLIEPVQRTGKACG